MHFPKISVIIPVYNVSSYLPVCLDSLTAQTCRDTEIICVDDGSTDNSLEILQRYANADPRIRILQQPHRGVSAARNLGLQAAVGDYIAFLDADDWMDPDMLQILLCNAEKTGCDVAVCSSLVHFEQDNFSVRQKNSVQKTLTAASYLWTRSADCRCPWQLIHIPGSWPFVWNKLIRRSLITDNAIAFSPDLTLGEDGVFMYILFQYARKVLFLSDTLHHYRFQRKGSATDLLFLERRLRFRHHLKVADEMLQQFQNRDLLADCKVEMLSWILSFLYADFLNLPSSNRKETACTVHSLLLQYNLMNSSSALGLIARHRLRTITNIRREVSPPKRCLEILWMKVENQILRILDHRHHM